MRRECLRWEGCVSLSGSLCLRLDLGFVCLWIHIFIQMCAFKMPCVILTFVWVEMETKEDRDI